MEVIARSPCSSQSLRLLQRLVVLQLALLHRQSLIEHEGLLHMANRDAAVLLQNDPKLTSERGRAVRVLLRLFEKAVAMRTLAAG